MLITETIVWNEELAGVESYLNHIVEGASEQYYGLVKIFGAAFTSCFFLYLYDHFCRKFCVYFKKYNPIKIFKEH